jgi:hypothetical protein
MVRLTLNLPFQRALTYVSLPGPMLRSPPAAISDSFFEMLRESSHILPNDASRSLLHLFIALRFTSRTVVRFLSSSSTERRGLRPNQGLPGSSTRTMLIQLCPLRPLVLRSSAEWGPECFQASGRTNFRQPLGDGKPAKSAT